MTDLGLYCVDQNTGNMSCSVISDMLFGTQIVFVIICSNLMFIIFEDQGKYWHILLTSTLIWGGRVERWFWVNFQYRGVLLIWNIVGQGPTALAVGADGGCLEFFLSSIISLFILPLSGRRPDID